MPLSFLNNPLFFAAALAVALGVAVYEIVSHNRQEEKKRKYQSSRPPPSPPHPPSPKRNKSNPVSTSCDSNRNPRSSVADTESNVRKRNSTQTVSKSCSSEGTQSEAKQMSVDKENSSSEDQIASRSSNVDNDKNVYDKKFDEKTYEKNVLNKIIKDTKDEDKKKVVNFVKNIDDDEDSDSSENNSSKQPEEKVFNSDTLDQHDPSCSNSNNEMQANQSEELKSIVNSSLSSEESFESSSSEYCDASLDSEKELYKEKVSNNLKNNVDINNKSHHDSPASSIHISGDSAKETNEWRGDEEKPLDAEVYKRNVSKNLKSDAADSSKTSHDETQESSIGYESPVRETSQCRGCDEQPVNTRLRPCNHLYLCIHCAHRMFALYKKCIVCHNIAKEFVEFEP